ncbi:uncharacterized protein LOC111701121 isoform X2 [Eurytemora carolleeae]|uniref:uncharacterized protein LOC111701121 isoform X2 n=1 Tax=Eurytemora carolleeae TaxID=1294199 RepID=UPI000C763171|nr:uncharacterized protein LOC111701121 isoform X2 [Eurytemora carolleeae]|eukprot:XP_023328050.1 uncharacterized protein LOC111701121 isoform X2 [Eurytemora affinis]
MEKQEGLEKGLTPSLNLPEERPYCSEDYLEQLPNSLHVLLNIQAETVENKHLGLLLVLICEHMHISTNSGENNASNSFENPENLEFTKILEIEENSENDQSSWMSWMSWSSFSHHEQVSRIKLELETNLQKKFSTILEENLSEIFQILSPRLETWTFNPAACHSACVVFSGLDGKLGGEHFTKIFPYLLRWLDSWMVWPRLMGVHFCKYILTGIPSSYLTKYGRDNVLYDALLPSLYTKDIEVLESSVHPLIYLLKLCSKDSILYPAKISKVDLLVEKTIACLDMESNMKKKLVLSKLLQGTWDLLGPAELRWVSRLSGLIQSEIQVLGQHCLVLLNIWQGIIVRHPDAAARECRTLLPGLVKIAWSWSHGQTPEYFREQT